MITIPDTLSYSNVRAGVKVTGFDLVTKPEQGIHITDTHKGIAEIG